MGMTGIRFGFQMTPQVGYGRGYTSSYSLPSPGYWAPPATGPLRIVYYNDPHEKFAAMPHMVSGFRQKSLEGMRQGQDVLRLSGGDNNIGKETAEWHLNVGLMNMLALHGTALGNHELDQGTRSFSEGMHGSNFPVLVANMNINPWSSFAPLIRSGRVVLRQQVVNGQYGPYGLIGVTTPDLDKVLDRSVPLEGMSEKEFDETCAIVQQQVNELMMHGINRIVLLSHMGYELEKKLAKTVSGIDVIVGGHSHDVLPGVITEHARTNPFAINQHEQKPNFVTSPAGEPVMIVQAGKDGRLFGTLDLAFDPYGRIANVQNNIHRVFNYPADPAAVALISRVLGPPKPLARITTEYANEFIPFQEDPVAQFAADAARRLSKADIAFVRSSEIRNDIHPGWFTDLDLKALMPFSDPFVRLKMTGAEIRSALGRSANGLKQRKPHPGMLHPSGMQVVMNERTGQVVGAKVWDSEDREWEDLEDDETYTVAVGEFTVNNGKEFPEFHHADRIDWRSDKALRNVFLWGLEQAGAPQKALTFKTDGRLKITKG